MDNFVESLSSDFPAYLRDLETLVNIDSGTRHKPGVDAVVRLVRERLREFGAEAVDYAQSQYGDCVYGCWRGRGSARILLIGHADTVYADGTASQFPFRRKGSRAIGPGVNDMKAGLLNGAYALNALVRSGFDDFAEVGLFCDTDEEVGSPASRELYAPLAKGADAALILEPARVNGALVSARKGVGTYKVIVKGKSAHAGVEPDKGANAIFALARYIEALQQLNGLRPGLTISVGVIRGGTRPNVVPDRAEAEIDVRVAVAADVEPLEQAMRQALATPALPGTRADLSGGLANPPMEKTQATARLVALAQEAARQLGFEVEDVATGGGSDGNFTAALGTPTLDGLGPIGGKSHNAMEEWVDLDSVVPRAAMLAKLIAAIAGSK